MALAYYSDHSQELDQELERRLKIAEQARQGAEPSPLKAKLAV